MANVINRITKEILLSVNTPDYPGEDWVINPPNLNDIVDKPKEHFDIIDGDIILKSQEEIDTMSLPSIKEKRYAQIDYKTQTLIAQGFVYNERIFSLSMSAQSTLLGAVQARENLAYPLHWNLFDDSGVYDIVDADELKNFYLTAVTTVRNHIDKGTDVKRVIRNTTTIDEANAVVDPR